MKEKFERIKNSSDRCGAFACVVKPAWRATVDEKMMDLCLFHFTHLLTVEPLTNIRKLGG